MLKALLAIALSTGLYAVCYPDSSCEEVLKEANKEVLDATDDRIKGVLEKLDATEKKYDEINAELEKNIEDLNVLLNQEILVNAYLNKILFEAKREVSINAINSKRINR